MKLAKFILILYIVGCILLLYAIIFDNRILNLVISGMLVPIIFFYYLESNNNKIITSQILLFLLLFIIAILYYVRYDYLDY